MYLHDNVLVQSTCVIELCSSCDLLSQTHDFVIPHDDLSVITWETDFGKESNSAGGSPDQL